MKTPDAKTTATSPVPAATASPGLSAPAVTAPAMPPGPAPAVTAPVSSSTPALTASDIDHIIQLSASYTAELQSKMARIDEIIGAGHWPSVGAFKESILRRHLADKVPRKFEVGTGFVFALHQGKKLLSKQLDIIVWNSCDHVPLFRDGEFVILPPEAVAAVISVKKRLDSSALREALDNVDSVTQFLDFRPHMARLFTAIFAFDIDQEVAFPDSIFNALSGHYLKCAAPTIAERLAWSREHGREWQAAWIDDVVVLPKGIVSLFEARVNNSPQVSGYAAYQTSATYNDTFGFLERDLMAHLLSPGPAWMLHKLGHAGAASIIFASQRTLWPGKSYTLIPLPTNAVMSLGALDQKGLAEFNARLHRPRKPRVKKAPKATSVKTVAAAKKKPAVTPKNIPTKKPAAAKKASNA